MLPPFFLCAARFQCIRLGASFNTLFRVAFVLVPWSYCRSRWSPSSLPSCWTFDVSCLSLRRAVFIFWCLRSSFLGSPSNPRLSCITLLIVHVFLFFQRHVFGFPWSRPSRPCFQSGGILRILPLAPEIEPPLPKSGFFFFELLRLLPLRDPMIFLIVSPYSCVFNFLPSFLSLHVRAPPRLPTFF